MQKKIDPYYRKIFDFTAKSGVSLAMSAEIEQQMKWYRGTEILSRKWAKKDKIEYDSEPKNKCGDTKSHRHKAMIVNINTNNNKIILKYDDDGYCSHSLASIKIKLPYKLSSLNPSDLKIIISTYPICTTQTY